jgi:hypothetical protein
MSTEIVVEDVPDVLLRIQLETPHVEQVLLGTLALQVEQVVVLEVPEGGGLSRAPTTIRKLVPVTGTMDVGIGAGGPEDRSDLLLTPFVIRNYFPGEWALGLGVPETHLLSNRDHSHLPG